MSRKNIYYCSKFDKIVLILKLVAKMRFMDAGRKLAVYVRDRKFLSDPGFIGLADSFESLGYSLYPVSSSKDISEGTSMILSVGGDGTFLSAACVASDSGIPVLGVNFGRLGFLSENRPEDVCRAVAEGDYTVERRTLLHAELSCCSGDQHIDGWPYALNEITVHRSGAATLGVTVKIDGNSLPAYWSDGLLVATSSGSTAYSLSVGGPIVLPESRVLIIAPIAPHNLNVRPMIVPDTSVIEIGFLSRDRNVLFTADNRNAEISAGTRITVSMARFSLNRIKLNSSNFINALTGKLFWGEDIRNGNNQQ